MGTLTVELALVTVIGFDALGFTGWSESQQTVVEANFDNFRFVPEPVTVLPLGLGVVMLRKKR